MSDLFWSALALVLVLEGLLPALSPRLWRQVFVQLLNLSDAQLRYFGLSCLLGGVLLLWCIA